MICYQRMYNNKITNYKKRLTFVCHCGIVRDRARIVWKY